MKEFTPRPWQTIITDFILANKRISIFSGMGSGKTSATLSALKELRKEGPILVVAPLRVARSVWSSEIESWDCFSGLTYSKIVGTPSERLAAMKKTADIYTTNFENLQWLVDHWQGNWPYKTIVCDESSKLRGFRLRQGSARAKSLARVAHSKAARFIGLTGTPASNGLQDLWGQMWFVDKGQRLGQSFTAFSRRWFRESFDGYSLLPMPYAKKEIEDAIRDVCLSIDIKDWVDIQQPIVNEIEVELSPTARKIYEQMETEMYVQIEKDDFVAANAAVLTGKTHQIANGAMYSSEGGWTLIHDAKIDALKSVIEEACGQPVMVVYHFRSDLERLKKAFPQGKELDKDPRTEAAWNRGELPILFVHPASAGHGLSLQHGSNIMCFFSVDWSCENHEQVIERIGPTRQMQSGYNRPVYVHYLLAKDTIDYVILERLRSKCSVQDALREALKRRKS